MANVWNAEFAGFLPFRNFLIVPKRPRQAILSAMGLYDAVEPRQRWTFRAAVLTAEAGLGRFLPTLPVLPKGLEPDWWAAWYESWARAHVGPIEFVAYRVPPNGRTAALLMDGKGHPLAFAKQLSRPPTELERQITGRLNAGDLPLLTPRVLAEGEFEGINFRLYTPLPRGPHRRPPHDVRRLRGILDAWQASVSGLTRPPGVGKDGVVCHADFTARNLRVASDGRWWLIDWDNARWGPRLADELHYWSAEYCWRRRPRVNRDAQKVLSLLRQRGTDDEIAAAVDWPSAPTKAYRAIELELRASVGELARRATGRLPNSRVKLALR